MSTSNIGDRPFPAIIHVKRGNELRNRNRGRITDGKAVER